MAFSVFRRFFGGAVNTASGYAIGGAMQPALDPLTQDLANRTWQLHPDRPVDPVLLAEADAQGQINHQTALDEAAMSGINETRFLQMRAAFDTGPGISVAFDLWRRGVIDEAAFRRAAKRAALEQEWIDALVEIHDVLLSADQLANAVVQGHMTMDAATAEAGELGVSAERFAVLVANTGLPPGPETLLAWRRRGIINDAELDQGIREGHTKTKYIPFYHQALAPVLSHTTYAGLRLRGWLTKSESDAGGALTGYTPEQMQLEYLNRGRPATEHQIHLGYARGAKLAGAADEVDAIRTAIKQSDIRPEYADLLVAQRYTYPPFFALRALAQGKVIDAARMEEILLFEGWEPTLAHEVAQFYAKPAPTTTTENPWVAKAEQQDWTALHKAYVKTGASRADVEPLVARIVPNAADRDAVFSWWDDERTAQSLTAPAA